MASEEMSRFEKWKETKKKEKINKYKCKKQTAESTLGGQKYFESKELRPIILVSVNLNLIY